MRTKFCKRCQTEKLIDCFVRNVRAPDGFRPCCRMCDQALRRMRIAREAAQKYQPEERC